MENQLEVIVKESGLEPTKAQVILEKFQDYFEIAAKWEKKAKSILVTDESQKVDMQMARTGRLYLREKRIAIEKSRKELKSQSLREGKAIDGIANVLKALIVPIEQHLEKQEKFIEFREAKKAEHLRIEADKKAEVDRLAKEKVEAEERERIRLENERLKKAIEEREKAMEAERKAAELKAKKAREKADRERRATEEKARREQEKIEAEMRAIGDKARKERKESARLAEIEHQKQEAKLAKERVKAKAEREAIEKKARIEREKIEAARRKAEAELQKKKDAEEKLRIEEGKKAEALKRASDKKKLLKLIKDIRGIEIPEVKSKKAQKIVAEVRNLLWEVAVYIER